MNLLYQLFNSIVVVWFSKLISSIEFIFKKWWIVDYWLWLNDRCNVFQLQYCILFCHIIPLIFCCIPWWMLPDVAGCCKRGPCPIALTEPSNLSSTLSSYLTLEIRATLHSKFIFYSKLIFEFATTELLTFYQINCTRLLIIDWFLTF